MQPNTEPEFAAFAAIDWADQKHFWALVPADALNSSQSGELENKPEAVDVWATELATRFRGRPVAVCLEQSRGPLVYMLMKYAHLVLYPVHPATSARYRAAWSPSGAKSDPGDAALLLELVTRHRDRLRPLVPDTVETRLLQMLVEQRRTAVDDKTRLSNRLTARLKMFFPHIVRWFSDVDAAVVCALLRRWPTLKAVQGAHPGTLRKFFHAQNCRSEKLIQSRIDAIYAAMPATEDPAIVEAGALAVRQLAAQIDLLRANIAELDERIRKAFAEHPDSFLYASLPGAGPALEPRLLVAMGTDRNRYAAAADVQTLSGIAPVTGRSGNSGFVAFRRACPKFLRQTFHEFAAHSIAHSIWARACYDQKRLAGTDHHAAVRAIAFKWIRILYRCWRDRQPYDEQKYLDALQRRRSPLTVAGWQSIAGFQKLRANPA
jgi:transposase